MEEQRRREQQREQDEVARRARQEAIQRKKKGKGKAVQLDLTIKKVRCWGRWRAGGRATGSGDAAASEGQGCLLV